MFARYFQLLSFGLFLCRTQEVSPGWTIQAPQTACFVSKEATSKSTVKINLLKLVWTIPVQHSNCRAVYFKESKSLLSNFTHSRGHYQRVTASPKRHCVCEGLSLHSNALSDPMQSIRSTSSPTVPLQNVGHSPWRHLELLAPIQLANSATNFICL